MARYVRMIKVKASTVGSVELEFTNFTADDVQISAINFAMLNATSTSRAEGGQNGR